MRFNRMETGTHAAGRRLLPVLVWIWLACCGEIDVIPKDLPGVERRWSKLFRWIK